MIVNKTVELQFLGLETNSKVSIVSYHLIPSLWDLGDELN